MIAPAPKQNNPQLSLPQRLQWWAFFLFATVALSRVFEASRALTGGLPEASWVEFSLWFTALGVAFLFLALTAYRQERAKGAVLKTKAVMEFLDRLVPFGRLALVQNNQNSQNSVVTNTLSS